MGEPNGHLTCSAWSLLLFEHIGEFNVGEEADTLAMMLVPSNLGTDRALCGPDPADHYAVPDNAAVLSPRSEWSSKA